VQVEPTSFSTLVSRPLVSTFNIAVSKYFLQMETICVLSAGQGNVNKFDVRKAPADSTVGAERVKRAFDVAVSLLALALLSPLLALVALLVLVAFGRPVLHRYRCVGLNGRPVDCLRFQATKNAGPDELPTRVGALLSDSGIVELPLLINVLRGEMSLVGPRPLRVDELGVLGEEAGAYLRTRPGLTGSWRLSSKEHPVRFCQGGARNILLILLKCLMEPMRAERRG
jgi:exopolysaccharide production protein ExoY